MKKNVGALLLLFFSCKAMEQPFQIGPSKKDIKQISDEIKTIDDIPSFVAEVIHRLDEQPVATYFGEKNPHQLLPLTNSTDTSICEIINNTKKYIIRQYDCYIHPGEVVINGIKIKHGIWRPLYHNLDKQQNLENAYKQIINSVKAGWIRADKTPPHWLVKNTSIDEWSFYKKKTAFFNEDSLIRFLIKKFDIEGKIYAQEEKESETDKVGNCSVVYLWLIQSAHDEVVSKLCLNLQK